MNLVGLPAGLLQARIEHGYGKSKLAKIVPMEVLTPASPADLPPLGELIADEPFWRYPSATTAGVGVAHLRVWLTIGAEPGHLAVVTETGLGASVSESAGRIWSELTRRYGPSLVLLEHYLAPEFGEGMETLDLVRIGADGSPHWSRVWPTPEDNPRHAGLELWMATYGYHIVSRPSSEYDWRQDEDGLARSSLWCRGSLGAGELARVPRPGCQAASPTWLARRVPARARGGRGRRA